MVENGIGVRDEIRLRLDDMVANKHYGLAGMQAQTTLIGAALNILSKPQAGTQIHIIWKSQ